MLSSLLGKRLQSYFKEYSSKLSLGALPRTQLTCRLLSVDMIARFDLHRFFFFFLKIYTVDIKLPGKYRQERSSAPLHLLDLQVCKKVLSLRKIRSTTLAELYNLPGIYRTSTRTPWSLSNCSYSGLITSGNIRSN